MSDVDSLLPVGGSPRKPRVVVSDRVDKGSPAYRIIMWLGGLTACARLIERNHNTVYGWMLRGIIPAAQQQNVREKAAEAGKAFPAEWFTERAPEPAAEAEADAAEVDAEAA